MVGQQEQKGQMSTQLWKKVIGIMTHIPWEPEVVWGFGESLPEEVILELRFAWEANLFNLTVRLGSGKDCQGLKIGENMASGWAQKKASVIRESWHKMGQISQGPGHTNLDRPCEDCHLLKNYKNSFYCSR